MLRENPNTPRLSEFETLIGVIKSFNQFDTVTRGSVGVAVTSTVCYFRVSYTQRGAAEAVSVRDQLSRQIDRLVSSQVLHGSESLCKLLRYLGKHATERPGTALKEYQIATEVFGRPQDFDPQLDSTIRVQAGRLRTKLAEYYATEGVDDSIQVEVPKGSYTLAFHHRASTNTKTHTAEHHEHFRDEFGARSQSKNLLIAVVVLSILLALSIAATAALLATRNTNIVARADSSKRIPAALQIFWKPFLGGPREPLVIFSNAAFVGRPETGLRYVTPAKDSTEPIFDHYTGVGEVLAVHDLDGLFESLNRHFVAKRGSLFSLDDAKNNDLIFVGSPSENLTLGEIPSTREMVFQRLATGRRKGDLAIANLHPEPGEAAYFVATPATSTMTEDYAVIALTPGLNSSRSILVLAGTTTFGTQGAVEYVCHSSSVGDLLSRLSVSPNGDMQPFEGVLRVKISHGVPVEAELVALRKRGTLNAP
jgi:hypothetical protein